MAAIGHDEHPVAAATGKVDAHQRLIPVHAIRAVRDELTTRRPVRSVLLLRSAQVAARLVIVPAVDRLPMRHHLVTSSRIGLRVVAQHGVAIEVRQQAAGLRRGTLRRSR